MTASVIQHAKAYADVRGFTTRPGGWIYSPTGQPVAHGWAAFADHLVATRRIVRLGTTPKGDRFAINWRADDLAAQR
jgi:hypothetical protein